MLLANDNPQRPCLLPPLYSHEQINQQLTEDPMHCPLWLKMKLEGSQRDWYKIMKTPIVAIDGITYEKETIYNGLSVGNKYIKLLLTHHYYHSINLTL